MRLLTISINDSATVGYGDLCIEKHGDATYIFSIRPEQVGKFIEDFDKAPIGAFISALTDATKGAFE